MNKEDFITLVDEIISYDSFILIFPYMLVLFLLSFAYLDHNTTGLNYNIHPGITVLVIVALFVLELLFISLVYYSGKQDTTYYAKLKFFCILLTPYIVSILWAIFRVLRYISNNFTELIDFLKQASIVFGSVLLWIICIAAFFGLNLWIANILNDKKKKRRLK